MNKMKEYIGIVTTVNALQFEYLAIAHNKKEADRIIRRYHNNSLGKNEFPAFAASSCKILAKSRALKPSVIPLSKYIDS